MRAKFLALAVAPVLFMAVSASADEGMWTFDNFPSAAVRQKYNVDVTPAWLGRVQNAAVRLSSGCSASVVSPNGLVLTNHHCVRDCVAALSTAQVNYIKDGFQATRYHSLVIDRATMPAALDITAETDDGIIMGVAHKTHPVHGVQFHPESIASQHGHALLQNFLKLARVHARAQPA